MTALGIPNNLTMGELVIDDVSLHTPAWSVLDLLPLWSFPPTRGSNVVIPGAAGKRAYRRRVDEMIALLQMLITGEVDQDDTPYDDLMEGLQTNLEYLWENVVSPPSGATRTAVLTLPDGSTSTGPVQVGLELGEHTNGLVKAVLSVTVPSGRLIEPSGS